MENTFISQRATHRRWRITPSFLFPSSPSLGVLGHYTSARGRRWDQPFSWVPGSSETKMRNSVCATLNRRLHNLVVHLRLIRRLHSLVLHFQCRIPRQQLFVVCLSLIRRQQILAVHLRLIRRMHSLVLHWGGYRIRFSWAREVRSAISYLD